MSERRRGGDVQARLRRHIAAARRAREFAQAAIAAREAGLLGPAREAERQARGALAECIEIEQAHARTRPEPGPRPFKPKRRRAPGRPWLKR